MYAIIEINSSGTPNQISLKTHKVPKNLDYKVEQILESMGIIKVDAKYRCVSCGRPFKPDVDCECGCDTGLGGSGGYCNSPN